MLAAYVDTTPITYVLEALPQSVQIVKPAMLESSGMKLLKSWVYPIPRQGPWKPLHQVTQ